MTWIANHWAELTAAGAAVGAAVLSLVAWGGRVLAALRNALHPPASTPDTVQQLLSMVQHMGEEQTRQVSHLSTEIEMLRGTVAGQERRIRELEHCLEITRLERDAHAQELRRHQAWCEDCPGRPQRLPTPTTGGF